MNSERPIVRLVRVGLVVAALFIFVVGAIFHLDVMFLMALALVIMPRMSWVIGHWRFGTLKVRRRLPSHSTVGESISVQLFVQNRSRWTQPFLTVDDTLPRKFRTERAKSNLLLELQPGSEREFSYQLRPEVRGRFKVGPARIGAADPLGFYQFTKTVGEVSDLCVYPRIFPLHRVFWDDLGGADSQLMASSRRRGAGMEFRGVREYQPGDELRHVHWRTTARTGKLAVAEYALGTSPDTEVFLDIRISHRIAPNLDHELLELRVSIAASLCTFLLGRGQKVQLTVTSDARPALPVMGPKAVWSLLERLVDADANSPEPLGQALRRLRTSIMLPNLVIITSFPDFGDLALELAEEERRGRNIIGVVVAGSEDKTPEAHRLRIHALPGQWRRINQNEDLTTRMEK